MATKRIELTQDELPAKVHLEQLQAAVDAAAGRPVGMTRHSDPATNAPVLLLVEFDEAEGPVDEDAVRTVIKAHAPDEDDFEEMARKKSDRADRERKLERLLDRVDDLDGILGRVEALERRGRG